MFGAKYNSARHVAVDVERGGECGSDLTLNLFALRSGESGDGHGICDAWDVVHVVG